MPGRLLWLLFFPLSFRVRFTEPRAPPYLAQCNVLVCGLVQGRLLRRRGALFEEKLTVTVTFYKGSNKILKLPHVVHTVNYLGLLLGEQDRLVFTVNRQKESFIGPLNVQLTPLV